MNVERAGDPNEFVFDPGARGRRFAVVAPATGWPGDVSRLLESIAKHCAGADLEAVVVANAAPDVAARLEDLSPPFPARGVVFDQHVGFGASANAGIAASSGEIVVLVNPAVAATGDFLSPLDGILADRGVGLAGPWGLLSRDLREFAEVTPEGPGPAPATPREVDAVQGYFIAFARERAAGPGLFDPRFKFYRHADIELSLRWRDAGFRNLAVDLPLVRHAHREWEAMDPERREKKSRENHARLLRAWGGREDLLLAHR